MLNALNKILIASGLSLCLSACASTPRPLTAATASPSESVKQQTGCVETGSRIPDDCAAIGRAYNQRDIRTTGQTDTAAAMRMLDASLALPGR